MFQNLNAAEVPVGVRTGGADVGHLARDVVWKEMLPLIPLALAR